jgi:hypothetical protein
MAIYYPWDIKYLSIALSLTAIPVFTQLIIIFPILYRNKRITFLLVLLLMFMSAQVFWGIWATVSFVMYS